MDLDRLREAVAAIPPGHWVSYGDLAAAAGGHDRHARALNQRFIREAPRGRAPRPEVGRHDRRHGPRRPVRGPPSASRRRASSSMAAAPRRRAGSGRRPGGRPSVRRAGGRAGRDPTPARIPSGCGVAAREASSSDGVVVPRDGRAAGQWARRTTRRAAPFHGRRHGRGRCRDHVGGPRTAGAAPPPPGPRLDCRSLRRRTLVGRAPAATGPSRGAARAAVAGGAGRGRRARGVPACGARRGTGGDVHDRVVHERVDVRVGAVLLGRVSPGGPITCGPAGGAMGAAISTTPAARGLVVHGAGGHGDRRVPALPVVLAGGEPAVRDERGDVEDRAEGGLPGLLRPNLRRRGRRRPRAVGRGRAARLDHADRAS